MATNILAFAWIGLAYCIAASSLMAQVDSPVDLRKKFLEMGAWLEQQLPHNTDPEENLEAVRALDGSTINTNLRTATGIFIELATFVKCSDETLEKVRLISPAIQLQLKQKPSRIDILLKYFGSMAVIRCREYIIGELAKLQETVAYEHTHFVVDDIDIKIGSLDENFSKNALLKALPDALKLNVNDADSVKRSIEHKLIIPCAQYNYIIGDFLELVYAIRWMMDEDEDRDIFEEYPGFQESFSRSRKCSYILTTPLHDLGKEFSVELA